MMRSFVFFWMFLGVSLGQAEKPASSDVLLGHAEKPAPSSDVLKKETSTLANGVDKVISAAVPNTRPFQTAKATYLDGYGIVVTIETALEPPRNLFSNAKTPAETRTAMNQRLSELEDGIKGLLKDRAGTLQSVSDSESITVVVYISNFNPDVPNFPAQIVFTAKKEDPAHVTTRTFQ